MRARAASATSRATWCVNCGEPRAGIPILRRALSADPVNSFRIHWADSKRPRMRTYYVLIPGPEFLFGSAEQRLFTGKPRFVCALVLPPEPGAESGKAGRIPRDAHDLFADMNTDGEYGSMDFRHLRAGVCACDTEEIAHCELRAVIADTKNEAVQCSQKTHESKCGHMPDAATKRALSRKTRP